MPTIPTCKPAAITPPIWVPYYNDIPPETQWPDGGPASIAAAEQGVGFWKDKTYTDASGTTEAG